MKLSHRKKLYIGVLGALFALFAVVYCGPQKRALADTQGYQFDYNSTDVQSGSEIELRTLNALLSVEPKDDTEGLATTATVAFYSSEENVVKCEDTGIQGVTRLVRKGPGFATVTAVITDNGYNFAISCLVKVDLQITATNFTTIDYAGHKLLNLSSVGDSKKIILNYVDSATVTEDIVDWTSSNELVATVDDKGNVTATGAGSAEIKVTTKTVSTQSKALVASSNVVVAPIGSFVEDTTYATYQDRISEEISDDHFMIYVNGQSAANLVWKVYRLDSSAGTTVEKEIKSTEDILHYNVNEYSGSVNFYGVKAGTYVIRAYVDKQYVGNNVIPYFEAHVTVLFSLNGRSLLMNVGDSYDIIANSNIPDINAFSYSSDNSNVASVDATTGVIYAKNSSSVPATITLRYKNTGLFETGGSGAYASGVPDIEFEVTVIDGIELSYSEVTINTQATILLEPVVTDRVTEVIWTSSDPKIATVVNGLVTGVKEGTATITATQTINGIIKKAECIVYVQASVEKVTLDPKKLELGIGKFTTIQASIEPATLKGVSLHFVSSDESVVEITEAGKLSVTIKGVTGGKAVISAINQDNVIVGFCDVTVVQPVTGVVLSETEVTESIGAKVQLRATIQPDDATNQDVIWKSSNEKVATVSANGLVTMKSAGMASIICSSVDNPSIQGYCNVTVLKAVNGVSLDLESKEMYVGENYRMTYLVSPADASNVEVVWSTTNSSIVTVDSTGMVSAKGVGQAELMIKTVDGAYMDMCTIVVKQKPTEVKVAVNNLTMNAGEYFYMDAIVTPANASKEGLVWEISDTSIATIAQNGRITAKAAGKAVVMVKTDNGSTSFCTLTVLQAVTGLEINPKKVSIDVGDKFSLAPKFIPETASNTNVTWESSDEDVASVNQFGDVVGRQGGVAVIECRTDDGGYNAYCIVTVDEKVTELVIDPEQYKLGLGKTYKLVATVTNASASNKEIEWYSSDDSIVEVDSKGRIKGISLGYATITAVAMDGSDAEATCEVRVVSEVTGMSMNTTSITLIQGNTYKLEADVRPASATYNTPSWETTDENIALVDDDGVITAIGPGTAWVTARARDNSGKYCKCYVTVIPPIPATGVTTMVDEVILAPGERKTVVAKATPANTTDKMLWTSTDESVARVNQETGEITAVAPGNCSVIVMMDSGKKAVINVVVVGLNRTTVVMDYYSNGPQLFVEGATSKVRWYSSNNRVVEVSSNGQLTSRGSGTATIEARVNGRTLTCTVRVVSP